MDSFSKIPLSAPLAQSIVKHYFGSRRTIKEFQELKEGYYNASALLELDDGLKCVLKAAPPPEVQVLRYEKDIMRAEVEAMRLVGKRTLIPLPEIYCYDSSHSLLPSDFFMMSYLPGTPFHKLREKMTPEAQAEVEREMGRITRQISEITGPVFGYWAQPEPPGSSWRTCFAHMLQNLMLDGKAMDVQLPMPYDELYGLMQAHFSALDVVETPRLVHWDLWDGNVFVDPKTGRVSGVIDFERVMWADPLIEMVFMPMMPDGPAVQGFGQALFGEPEAFLRRLLYNSYLFLIMIIECSYRRYPTQDQENWARMMLGKMIAGLQQWPNLPPRG